GRRDPVGANPARLNDLVAELSSPSQAAQRVEAVVQVRNALDRLDPVDREILALRHFDELSNREAAALLGIGSAAATKRYARALVRLKKALVEDTDWPNQ